MRSVFPYRSVFRSPLPTTTYRKGECPHLAEKGKLPGGSILMNCALTILVSFAFAWSAFGQTTGALKADGDARKQLTQIEDDWAKAYNSRDTTELERILADDFTDLDENGTRDKRQYIASVKTLGPTSDSIVLSDRNLRVLGEAAVSTGQVRWASDTAGNVGRYIAVYVLRQGRWQAV